MDFANYGSASNLEDELAELMESALPGARSSLEVGPRIYAGLDSF